MSNRKLPPQIPGTLREWKAKKRAELRRVIRALCEFNSGCAYAPVYRHVDKVENLLSEMREALSEKGWGR